MTTFSCSGCGATIDADDDEDLMGKGWHILRAGTSGEGTEKVLCPRCFRQGMAQTESAQT